MRGFAAFPVFAAPHQGQPRMTTLAVQSRADPDSGRYLSEDYAFCPRWRDMGGKIWVESNNGKGSTFCVQIPVASQPKARVPTMAVRV